MAKYTGTITQTIPARTSTRQINGEVRIISISDYGETAAKIVVNTNIGPVTFKDTETDKAYTTFCAAWKTEADALAAVVTKFGLTPKA